MARKTRSVTVFGIMPMLMLMIVVARGFDFNSVYYVIFYLILFAWELRFKNDNPGVTVVDSQEFELRTLPAQAVGGAAFVVVPIIAIVIGSAPVWASNTLLELVFQAVFVSFVETYFLIVFVETVHFDKYAVGMFLWPFSFAFMHPEVRNNWFTGNFSSQSIGFFVYAALMGALFELIYLLRKKYDYQFAGPFASWVAHFLINAFVVLFPLVIFGLKILPV